MSPFAGSTTARIESRFDQLPTPPDQLRWDPLPMPSATAPTDFIDGLVTMAGNGAPAAQNGCGIHLYAANRSMRDRFFYDADGELLDRSAAGQAALRHRARAHRGGAAGDRRDSARRALPRRAPRRRGARLCLRELRRAVQAAGPGPDRLQRTRQSARFPRADGIVRGPQRQLRADRQVHGQSLDGRRSIIRRWTSSPGTATTRRTNTTCVASTRSDRRASIIRIRRSSWCCSRPATQPAST